MPDLYVVSQQAGQSTPGNGSYRGLWQASQTWGVGDRCVPTASAFYVHECTTAGAGGGSEPSWSTTPGNTTNDSSAVWTCRSPTSWANATITLVRAAVGDAAGDTVYVKNTHSESTAGAVTLAWAGTVADPTRIICVSDSNEPPTTVATGAVVATTGASSNIIVYNGSGSVYYYGISFIAGDSTNNASISTTSNAGWSTFVNCSFELRGSSTLSRALSLATNSYAYVVGCTFKFASASQGIGTSTAASVMVFDGCSLSPTGSDPSALFVMASNSHYYVSNCDFSNGATSFNVSASSSYSSRLDLRNCKMPASWSGSVNSSTPEFGSVFQLFNSDASDTNYRLQKKSPTGEVVNETTIKRTGGASDGTTGISWKMVSGANAEWSHQTLDTPEIVKWNETTGSSVTATVEFVHDSVTNMTDKEIWLEVMYLGTSGTPLGSTVSDAAANYLSSGADQTDSSETWTTTGLTNPNTQKLSVTFTPQEKGFVHAVVKLAKASKAVYVDPVLTIA